MLPVTLCSMTAEQSVEVGQQYLKEHLFAKTWLHAADAKRGTHLKAFRGFPTPFQLGRSSSKVHPVCWSLSLERREAQAGVPDASFTEHRLSLTCTAFVLRANGGQAA